MSSAFQTAFEAPASPPCPEPRPPLRLGWGERWVIGPLLACLCVLLFGAGSAAAAALSGEQLADSSLADSSLADSSLLDSPVPDSPVPDDVAVRVPGREAGGERADEPAPMCAPDGASVAAADEIPELDRGRFEALPCEAQLMMAGWRPDAPEFGCKASSFENREAPAPSAPEAPRPRCDGARELAVPFPERGAPGLLSVSPCFGLAPSRGHARNLFRPPVARG